MLLWLGARLEPRGAFLLRFGLQPLIAMLAGKLVAAVGGAEQPPPLPPPPVAGPRPAKRGRE
jgi:hypothetical protein